MGITKTRLQAFKEAQKTGQISITKDTAKLFANMLQMEELLQSSITLLAKPYLPSIDEDNRISEVLLKAWQPFCDAYTKEVCDYISNNSLSLLDFKGL